MYNKHKETILYLFFGVITTIVNWVSYSLIMLMFAIGINIANTIAWAISVIFAFITNKFFVFKKTEKENILKEFLMFSGTRFLSGILEISLLPTIIWLGVDGKLFGVEGFIAKIITTMVVFVVNYICTKFIFSKGGKTNAK